MRWSRAFRVSKEFLIEDIDKNKWNLLILPILIIASFHFAIWLRLER